jgi:hypothetical protein
LSFSLVHLCLSHCHVLDIRKRVECLVLSVKVRSNRQLLIRPEVNTISVMLGALNLALLAEQEATTTASQGQTLSEQILQIMETILQEASSQPPTMYKVSSDCKMIW